MEKLESKYSVFQAPVMAFFNKQFYADIAANGKGSGALYIFLLTTVAWLLSCAITFVPIATQVMGNKDVGQFLSALPHMTINDGKMSITEKSPFELKEPKSGTVIAVWDMNRKTTELTESDPPLVITADGAYGKEGTSNLAPASDNDSAEKPATKELVNFATLSEKLQSKFEIDGPMIGQFINQLCLWVPILIFVVGWPFVFLGHLILMLIYGMVGTAMANGMDKQMSFETAMRMAAIAITPTVVISVLLTPISPPQSPVPMIWALVSIGVALTYLYIGISASTFKPAATR